MKYRPEVDGLRAIAVIPVILFHAGIEMMVGGYVGVDVFFVISGYLITTIIATELSQDKFSLSHFYERRARRILPALFLIMAVSIPMALIWMDPSGLPGFSKSLAAVSLFSSNLLFWLESSYWGIASELKPLIHTWSLAIEEQYYVLFPLLMMLVWRLNKQWVWVVLIGFAALSLGMAQWASYAEPEANFFLLPTRAWELALGAITALILLNERSLAALERLASYWAELLAVMGLFMIGASIAFFDAKTPHPSIYTLMPTVGTAMLILFATRHTLVGQVMATKLLVTIGLWSYSAYLWHQLLFAFARHQSIQEPHIWVMAGLTLLTFPLAYLTHRFIEGPFRNPGFMSKRQVFMFAITGTLLFLMLGIWGQKNAIKLSFKATEAYFERQEFVDELLSERQQMVNGYQCHYSNWGGFKNIGQFMQQWSCLANDEPRLKASSMAIYGDSHSSDIANMLRLNEVDFLQVTGNGCPLLEHGRKRCQRLIRFFHEQATKHKIDTVIVANRYQKSELSPAYLKELIDYWGSRYQRVILFSPMVEFPYWQKTFILTGKYDFKADFSAHRQFYTSTKAIDVPDNITLVNTSQLFCESMDGCDGLNQNGELMIADYGHLSVKGAKQIGAKLIALFNNGYLDNHPVMKK